MVTKFRAAVVAGVLVLCGCSTSEDLKSLSSTEIDKLLKGNTVEGVLVAQTRPFRQYFAADGKTAQLTEKKRIGKWRIEDNNQFCLGWFADNTDKTKIQKEQCFSVKQDSQGKYSVYSANLGYAASLKKIVPGNPWKL